jgi:hypothetical protein
MIARTAQIIALLLTAIAMGACEGEKPIAAQFPGPWRDDLKPEIIRTLVAHQARGCGEFHWRAKDGRTDEFAEYLVYCTRDRVSWTAWLVWPGSGRASGPSAIDPGLPPPK